LYTAADKVVRFALKVSLPNVEPAATAVALLVANVPCCAAAWKAAATRSNDALLLGVTGAAVTSFQFAYHVHEKAIVTALVPLTAWTCLPTNENRLHLLWEWTAVACVGLFPILFPPQELPLKIFSLTAYLAVIQGLAARQHEQTVRRRRWTFLAGMAFTVTQLELIPVRYFGRYEFVPLAVTSLVCATALLVLTMELFARMRLTGGRVEI
jgi:alpha-1,3-glucosyltransferase